MPPKRGKSGGSKSNSRATSVNNNDNNGNNNNNQAGQQQWESLVDQLARETELSFDRDNAPIFDANAYVKEQKDSNSSAISNNNEIASKILGNANIQAFLQEKNDEFEREILGNNDANVALPLYVPRVNMIEATHVMPAEPAATDAFRYHLPQKIDQLPNSGPDWTSICNNAIEATQHKSKIKQALEQRQNQQQQTGAQQQQTQQQVQRRLTKLSDPGRMVDFQPIIIVPGGAMSVVQIENVRDLLQDGMYKSPHESWMDAASGATVLAKRDQKNNVIVSPNKMLSDEPSVKFREFRVVDDPALVDDWSHVCACFVTGQTWQFEGWFNNDPSKQTPRNILDTHVKGFLAYFEDEKTPTILKEWSVVGLTLSRRTSKAHMSIPVARLFWEQLFLFLERHPFFRQYTIPKSTSRPLIALTTAGTSIGGSQARGGSQRP